MTIFKCFFKVIIKNRGAILAYIGIFTALVLLLSSSATSEFATDYETTSLSVSVIDRDDSELSRGLTQHLDKYHNLADLPDDTDVLQDALFYRTVEYILIIPDGFEAEFSKESGSALLENVKLPGSMSGIYIDNQIDRYLVTLTAYLSAEFPLKQALANTSRDLELSTTVEMYGIQQEEISDIDYFFQFLAYVLMALTISALGPVLMAFNKRDLRHRMESSSLKLRERNMQMALGSILTSLGIWVVFMLIAFGLYRERMFSAASALHVLNSLVFLIVSVSMAFILGQFLKKTATLSAVTNAVALGMSFLCGIFVPQRFLGEGVLAAAKFLPAYWYVRSHDMLSGLTDLNAVNMQLFGEGVIIQLGFALAVFAVALVVSQQKKRNPAV